MIDLYTFKIHYKNESLKASVELADRELHGVELSLLKSTRIEKLERIEGSRTKHTRKKMINESSFFVKYIFALEKNVRTLSGDTPSPLYASARFRETPSFTPKTCTYFMDCPLSMKMFTKTVDSQSLAP